MNIVIPVGGKGERFRSYSPTPKPLIKIFEKTMIEYVIDSLHVQKDDQIFIFHEESINMKHIRYRFPNIIYATVNNTRGAVETVKRGIDTVGIDAFNGLPVIILDCDTFYTFDILSSQRYNNDNAVFYTINYESDPIYSYIIINNGKITAIKEKEKISDYANTGAYTFNHIEELYQECQYILDNNILVNNEPYTSCIIDHMIERGCIFRAIELNQGDVISLGTPTAVEAFKKSTYFALMDLDGTIVISDKIYYDVWNTILGRFNIILSPELYKQYIQGNNDKYVKSSLLEGISITMEELSSLKDELFIEKIDRLSVVDGAVEFIKGIGRAGHKVAIVTNCNRKVASAIIRYVGLSKYIDKLIASEDCCYGKPSAEPYIKAMEFFEALPDKCIIFEDSKTGLLSGKSSCPKLLVGLETSYNRAELISYGAHITIPGYKNTDFNYFISYRSNEYNDLVNSIKSALNITEKELVINSEKLKGGFIADVINFRVGQDNYVIKYENINNNALSSMAKSLCLYEREYYFFTEISQSVPICVPKFISLTYNDNHPTGVILENLYHKHMKPNLNLNEVSIDIPLKIVERMATLHSHYWNANWKPGLKRTNDPIFYPFLPRFINERMKLFIYKWERILNEKEMEICRHFFERFETVQLRFSQSDNLTLIHGDIKSPNIFYDPHNDNEPYFIDWQHSGIGKGVMDLIFFIIESFDIDKVRDIFELLNVYYYTKLTKYGIKYDIEEYKRDIIDAVGYVPFFTAVWFGTTPEDELIDKSFPHLFIKKMFHLANYLYRNYKDDNNVQY